MNWNTHQENICILGLQHSGKTSLAKNYLDSIPSVPRLIISPQQPLKLYGSYGNPISALSELIEGGAFVWVGKLDKDIFEAICKKVMSFSNMLLVVDDAHEFCSKQSIPKEWATLINSGRNRGITSIFISPSPNLLNNNILQSSQHLISFHFKLESQIEYARKNFFGDPGWLLLTPNLRPDKFKKYSKMDEHGYLYQNVNSEFVEYTNENGETITLKNIADFGESETVEEPVNDGPTENEVETEKVKVQDEPEQEPEPTQAREEEEPEEPEID